jgi:N-carbamoyl-L-amino-acid hydrolase
VPAQHPPHRRDPPERQVRRRAQSSGNLVWDWAEQLAAHSDPAYAERGELTVTYLTDAHRACAAQLAHWMREDCGFDEVSIDAVGNVVGLYHGSDRGARGC